MKARGYNGSCEFTGSAVIIRREGALARMSQGSGEKVIPLSSISAVQWKQPGRMTNGYIEFTIPGGREVRGVSKNASNENAVIVTHKQAADFLALKSAVESAISGAPAAQPAAPTSPPPPPPSVPAGWYPDPQGQPVQRYWDGGQWTEHTAPMIEDFISHADIAHKQRR